MNLLEADPNTDETLGMAGIRVWSPVQLLHVVDLRDIIGDQPGEEGDHAGIHRTGGCGFDCFRDLRHGLIRRH